MTEMDIKKLHEDVISKIRSSFNISSVVQCVLELVYNSLDAKSTSIAIRINLITFKIQVADNGEGISKENLEHTGVRYMTNRCHTIVELEKHFNSYGFRGEALASIVDMSKSIKISTRCNNSLETYTKFLTKDSRSEIKLAKRRPSVGTTVTVLGFLNNYPVRQKRIIQEIELEEVRKSIENVIIVNPGTSFSLRNDVTGLLILNIPKSCDIIESFRILHPEITDFFTLIKVSKNKVSLEALVHKDFILSKKYQYIYVNKKPVLSQRILSTVNKLFCKKMQYKIRRGNNAICETKKYPVFVLNIKCPQSWVDIFMKSSKYDVEFTCWELVLRCIEKMVKVFFGSDDRNITEGKVEGKEYPKSNCGVSQVRGVVQACAFKRKSDETLSEDNGNNDNGNNGAENISEPLLTKKKCLDPNLMGNKDYTASRFIKDKTVVSQKQDFSGNYRIDESGEVERNIKPNRYKKISKKPLPINIHVPQSKNDLGNHWTSTSDVTNSSHSVLDGPEEVNFDPVQEKCPVDDKAALLGQINEENLGKNIIMDMFLKSTQVYKGLSDNDNAWCDISRDTIEESNFVLENNVKDTIRGINTTMSINVNVKRKKMRAHKNKVSKGIQTSIIEGRIDRFSSKCVQTSQKTLQRVRSNLSDLTHKFDSFKLTHAAYEDVKDNYTIVINTIHKKREFRFVKKSEEMEVDDDEEDTDFRPLRVCLCHSNQEKMFKFGTAALMETEEQFKKSKCDEKFEQPKSDEKLAEKNYIPENHNDFRKPIASPDSKNLYETVKCHENKRTEKSKLNFRGIWKQVVDKAPQEMNICEKSPYFKKNKLVPNISTRKPEVLNVNDNNRIPHSKFQSRLKSKQEKPFQKHVAVSPYFAQPCATTEKGNFEYTTNLHWDKQINCNLVHNNQSWLPLNHDYQKIMPCCQTCIEPQADKYRFQSCHNPQNLLELAHHHNAGPLGWWNTLCGVPNIDFFSHLYCHKNVHPPIKWHPENKQYCLHSENLGHLSEPKNSNKRAYLKKQLGCELNQNNQEEAVAVGSETTHLIPNKDERNCNKKESNDLLEQEIPLTTANPFKSTEYSKKSFAFKEANNINTIPRVGGLSDNDANEHDNKFNLTFIHTPDIFSSEGFHQPIKKLVSETNGKSGKVRTETDLPDMENFVNLANFGVTEDDFKVSDKTTVENEDQSILEITLADERQKRYLIERELFKENKVDNDFGDDDIRPQEVAKNENVSDGSDKLVVGSQNEWIRKYNETGKGFYFNTRTGMVSTVTPKLHKELFDFDRRMEFIPKGMSQVLEGHKKIDKTLSQNAKSKLHDLILESYDNELMLIKWENFIGDDPRAFFEEIYKEKCKQFENCIPTYQDSAVKGKLHKEVIGFKTEMFGNLDVIGQLDKKFIVAVETNENMIILFDQHAVHERIRLERFLKEYRGLKSPCKTISLFVPKNDMQLLRKHSDYLSSVGLEIEFFKDGVRIMKIPSCLNEKFKKEENSENLTKVVSLLVKEIVESLKDTRGSSTLLPKILQNVINLKACRGAIKFGDSLNRDECEKLLKDLSKCILPFQCAHGRPTLTPILTLGEINQKKKEIKPNLNKLLQLHE